MKVLGAWLLSAALIFGGASAGCPCQRYEAYCAERHKGRPGHL